MPLGHAFLSFLETKPDLVSHVLLRPRHVRRWRQFCATALCKIQCQHEQGEPQDSSPKQGQNFRGYGWYRFCAPRALVAIVVNDEHDRGRSQNIEQGPGVGLI